ncbi:MAG: hypothetical protein LBS62_12180 [Clostridiales bacterium]|nr:hypothetical protein [Clostridiales bacterium]
MSDKEDKQARLIAINNLCLRLSAAIEKFYSSPDAAELHALIKGLSGECGEYLKALPP